MDAAKCRSTDDGGWISTAMLLIDFIKAIVWPALIGTFFTMFRAELSAMLTRTSQFKVKVAGVEVTFSGAEAGPLMAAVLNEVAEAAQSFTPKETQLFNVISATSGSPTVNEITQTVFGKTFTRDSYEHKAFRALHRANLIRPRERNMWLPDNHPELTTLGRLVRSEKLQHARG